mgnify:CR=1 FL=1
MNEQLLPLAVWVQVAYGDLRERAMRAWRDRADESGVDEAVTKMVWLAVGIVVALAATAFFTPVAAVGLPLPCRAVLAFAAGFAAAGGIQGGTANSSAIRMGRHLILMRDRTGSGCAS